MAHYEMRLMNVTVREPGDTVQPTIRTTLGVGEHEITISVTALGFYRLTGRRHERVTAMHAAYGRKRGHR